MLGVGKNFFYHRLFFSSLSSNKKHQMKIKLLLGLSTLALAFAPMAKKVDLQFRLEKGKTYTQTTLMHTETKQSIQGTEQIIQQTAHAETSMELKNEGSGSNTYTLWYENISMSIDQGGMKQEFSSDTTSLDNVDPMSQIFAAMTKRKFDADIDLKGNIKEVKGLEEIITDATSPMGEQASMINEQISAGFGDSGLAKNLGMFTAIMPEGTVKEGSTWTNEQFTASGLPLILRNTFTLKSITDGMATIEVKAVISVDPANSTQELQGMKASYFLEGNRTGTMQMEVKTGFVTSANIDDEIVGSINLESSPQMPEGMTIPIEMNSNTKLSSK